MDKQVKLQRYRSKSYTDTVHFPVEIIGRDGVVRQYSFEDSVRLYQRRVTFAAIRYGDKELVEAELAHCRARIRQLRVSYFHWYGWGTADGQQSPESAFGELAGEVAAFLRRILRSVDRVDASLICLGRDAHQGTTWFLEPAGLPSMLLYTYDFRMAGADRARERFFHHLKELEASGKAGGDSERLVAFHHGGDCAFALSAKGSDYELISSCERPDHTNDVRQSPLSEALRVLRANQAERALKLCRDRLREFPWHRQAYYLASSIARHIGNDVEAEELLVLGAQFFPNDPEMRYRLGRVRVTQARKEEGYEDLYKALALDEAHRAAVIFLAVSLLRDGRLNEAKAVLSSTTCIDREISALIQWVQWRRVFSVLSGLLVVVGSFAIWRSGVIGLLLALTGLGLLALGWVAFTKFLDEVWKREAEEDPATANFQLPRIKGRAVS